MTLPMRTASLDFRTRLPSIRVSPSSMIACAKVRLFTSRMQWR